MKPAAPTRRVILILAAFAAVFTLTGFGFWKLVRATQCKLIVVNKSGKPIRKLQISTVREGNFEPVDSAEIGDLGPRESRTFYLDYDGDCILTVKGRFENGDPIDGLGGYLTSGMFGAEAQIHIRKNDVDIRQ